MQVFWNMLLADSGTLSTMMHIPFVLITPNYKKKKKKKNW
jgi:hypothetical protein